jgi:hypothetical protein
MNDLEQRITAMSTDECRNCLLALIIALHSENIDNAYKTLRDWNLEQEIGNYDGK